MADKPENQEEFLGTLAAGIGAAHAVHGAGRSFGWWNQVADAPQL